MKNLMALIFLWILAFAAEGAARDAMEETCTGATCFANQGGIALVQTKFPNQAPTINSTLVHLDSAMSLRVKVLASECRTGNADTSTHDAALVVLGTKGVAKQGDDFQNLLRALRSTQGIGDKGRAEVNVFLDEADGFTSSEIEQILGAAAPRNACAITIQFAKFPDGNIEKSASPWPKRSKWGYEHMIRFFFVDLLDIKGPLSVNGHGASYKYWLRMDSDSTFSSCAGDPFEPFDSDPELGYLRNGEICDGGEVAKGLRELAEDYIAAHGVDRSAVKALYANKENSMDCVGGFYNNLELGRISAFQSKEAEAWRDTVVSSKGIYLHRWGDALLRRLTIELSGIKVKESQLRSCYYHYR